MKWYSNKERKNLTVKAVLGGGGGEELAIEVFELLEWEILVAFRCEGWLLEDFLGRLRVEERGRLFV